MNFWWIDEPLVLAGVDPTIWELKGLYRIGFRTIIFLIDKMEQAPDYPNYNVEAIKAMGFEQFPITIGDFSAPSVEDFELVLTTVDWAVDRGKIFVHCQDGFRGTAIIGTAYWVYRGFSVKEAIEKIRQSNPQTIERVEPEKSLYRLKAVIESGNTWGKTPSSWLK